jgi:hypothetical protein
VFRNEATIEYREAIDTVLRVGRATGLLQAEAESHAREGRLAAERALDSVLADSFPASDPPPWTLGITRPQPERQGMNETAARDDSPVGTRESVIDVSRPATDGQTFPMGLMSLAGAAGIALLVPFVILLIGMPIALAIRGITAAAGWLLALILG